MFEILKVVVNYFSNHFREFLLGRPRFDDAFSPSILEEDSVSLTAPFLFYEIDWVVGLCVGNKSVGPDDFDFYFLKRSWPLLKDELGLC